MLQRHFSQFESFAGAEKGAELAQWWERSPPTNLARVQFRPGVICGLGLLLVLALLRGFFPGSLVFLPPQNQHSKNSNSTRIEDPCENQLRLMWLSLLCCNLFLNHLYIYVSGTTQNDAWNSVLSISSVMKQEKNAPSTKCRIVSTALVHFPR